jgi:hypothetical protein
MSLGIWQTKGRSIGISVRAVPFALGGNEKPMPNCSGWPVTVHEARCYRTHFPPESSIQLRQNDAEGGGTMGRERRK